MWCACFWPGLWLLANLWRWPGQIKLIPAVVLERTPKPADEELFLQFLLSRNTSFVFGFVDYFESPGTKPASDLIKYKSSVFMNQWMARLIIGHPNYYIGYCAYASDYWNVALVSAGHCLFSILLNPYWSLDPFWALWPGHLQIPSLINLKSVSEYHPKVGFLSTAGGGNIVLINACRGTEGLRGTSRSALRHGYFWDRCYRWWTSLPTYTHGPILKLAKNGTIGARHRATDIGNYYRKY